MHDLNARKGCRLELNNVIRSAALLAFSLGLAGCNRYDQSALEISPAKGVDGTRPAGGEGEPEEDGNPEHRVAFRDITTESGLRFRHFNDASVHRYLPETMGSGAAFFDYDGDGRPDFYLVNGAPLTGDRRGARPGMLARNLDGLRFQDVTQSAGLVEPLYGMGAAVGDFNNDGHLDLFVTALPGDRLYKNKGDGTFEDVTRSAALPETGFSTSAAFLDFDRDGYQDLLVGRYVRWDPQTDTGCSPDGRRRIYCTPEVYPGQSNLLLKNIRGQVFRDVTESSGIYRPEGKTLGIAVLDVNNDGWPDIAIANNTVPNFLFLNNRDGTFTEVAAAKGFAYGESGSVLGGMGIDTGDINGSGLDDVVIGRFSQEMTGLFRATEAGYFVDDALQSGIGIPTLPALSFGTLLIDFDNDGWLDLVHANGHIEPRIKAFHPQQSYRQVPQFFRNRGNGEFQLLANPGGGVHVTPLVGRGLAAADIDGDGDLDLLITQNGGRARLIRNETAPQSWIAVRLVGRASNRTGYGAAVRLYAGRRTWTRLLNSGGSYLSASDPVLTIGLGPTTKVDRLEISWPSGVLQNVDHPQLNRLHVIEEP